MSVRPLRLNADRGIGEALASSGTGARPSAHFAEVLTAALAARTPPSLLQSAARVNGLEDLRWALVAGPAHPGAGLTNEPMGWALLALALAGRSRGMANPETGVARSPPPATPDLEQIIGRAAKTYELAPALLRAIVRAESDSKADAVSPAGAMGLMQLMPETAESLGVTDPFDPEQNVMAGARFFRSLLDRYGDLDSALAAYNWGPGNLDRAKGGLPRETREYVGRVKRFYSGHTG